ncbi:MAG: hypothetical protein Q4B88_02820 [Moraxella sp.]|nr:hypothetical protein [Moraxella sp.]
MSIYNEHSFGNSIFKGLNDKNGLMICGYEYGYSTKDENHQTDELLSNRNNVVFTFANKVPFLGEYFWTIPYDNRIAKWFELWGHPLDRVDLGGDFEKSIVQTNWSDSQNNNMGGKYDWLLNKESIGNFIEQVEFLKPSVIFFMGSKLIDFLNNPKVLPRFEKIVGNVIENRKFVQKDSKGTRFKVHFQRFEQCQVVCFPHPSASRGLSLEYITQFKPEMDKLLQEYKQKRGF